MFKRATGIRYPRVLAAIHEAMLFDCYLEIGCRTGTTVALSQSRTIAVDPFFQVRADVIANKPALHVMQMTSDDFFDSGFLARNDMALSFSFLDGMHLFEFLLRDFRNAEANSRPGAVIAMHDCVPAGVPMTTRDLDNLPPGSWTGDVWKLIPILRKYRPDLTLTVLNAAPTGLVLVGGLDPANRVLFDRYDEIVTEFSVPITTFGIERFAATFDLTDAEGWIAADFPGFGAVRKSVVGALRPQKITP
jgi:hypothetical protein